MTIAILKTQPNRDVDDMLSMIDNLRERVAAGEFETIWLLAWAPDRKLLSAERGTPKDRLTKVGALEAFKQDLLHCMETGEPTGF